MKNKHLYEIDFIRFICALGIIFYHFSYYTNSSFKPMYKYTNGDFGALIVTVFFIVSGFVLYLNNKEVTNIKTFYYKRFKSIFPMFYLVWLIFYIKNVITVRYPFYAGNPLKFLLTVIGQDGYFSQRIIDYYTVGEWFLGALIFVYLLYPLLSNSLNKKPILTLIILTFLYEIITRLNLPVISPGFPSITESCLKVYIGMMFAKKFGSLYDKKLMIVSLIYFVIYTAIPVQIKLVQNELNIINGMALFIVLLNLGKILTNTEFMKKILNNMGKLTYPIFLFQHQMILVILNIYNPSSVFGSMLALLICVVIIIICSIVADYLIKKLFKTEIYQKFEKKFI